MRLTTTWTRTLYLMIALLTWKCGAARADSLWMGQNGVNAGAWDDPLNWENGNVPPANDDTTGVLFKGNRTLQTDQNIADPITINALKFDAQAGAAQEGFVITGRKIAMMGNDPRVTNRTANPAISHRVAALLDLTKDIVIDGNGTARLNLQALSGVGGFTKDKDSAYVLLLDGSTANAHQGTSNAFGGTVELNKSTGGTLAIPGALVIGDGQGSAATVNVRQNEQIANSSNVTVNAGGKLVLVVPPAMNSTLTESIATLRGSGGVELQGGAAGQGRSTTLRTGGAGENAPFSGSITGAGNLVKIGNNTLVLSGMNTYTGSTTVSANGGILSVTGQIGAPDAPTGIVRVMANGRLRGTGKIYARNPGPVGQGVTIERDGSIKAGNSPGILTIDGGLELEPGALLAAELNGPVADNLSPGSYSQLDIAGEVILGGSTLDATLGYVPSTTDKLFIVKNDASDPVSGMFTQGTSVDVVSSIDDGIYRFLISYVGDFDTNTAVPIDVPGNDVVLYNAMLVGYVPEPASWVLLCLGGASACWAVCRRRRG